MIQWITLEHIPHVSNVHYRLIMITNLSVAYSHSLIKMYLFIII